jgi:hypothetical protein
MLRRGAMHAEKYGKNIRSSFAFLQAAGSHTWIPKIALLFMPERTIPEPSP